jgi:Transcription elongation factor
MKQNTTDVTYLSKSGMRKLKLQISKLERDVKRLAHELRNLGKSAKKEDCFEKIELLSQLTAVKSDLAEKRSCLKKAKLLVKNGKSGKVSLGSFVELLDRTTGRIFKFTVVESIETDPSNGKISVDSPLGRNLIGKQVRDVVNWVVGVNSMQMLLTGVY